MPNGLEFESQLNTGQPNQLITGQMDASCSDLVFKGLGSNT